MVRTVRDAVTRDLYLEQVLSSGDNKFRGNLGEIWAHLCESAKQNLGAWHLRERQHKAKSSKVAARQRKIQCTCVT